MKCILSLIVVAPFAGAWIEIQKNNLPYDHYEGSLPSRERGLKYNKIIGKQETEVSLPSRERGLKWTQVHKPICISRVAPFAGAWIEI